MVRNPKRRIGKLDVAYDLYSGKYESIGFLWLEPSQYKISLRAALNFSVLDDEVLKTLPTSILKDRNRINDVDLENIHEFTRVCLFVNHGAGADDMFEDDLKNPSAKKTYYNMLTQDQISFARFDVDINKGPTRLKYTVTASNPEVVSEPINMDFLNLKIPLAYGFGDHLAGWVWDHQKIDSEIEKEQFMNYLQKLIKNYIKIR